MQLEFHQLELTYKKLRCHDAKRQAQLVASVSEHGQQSPVMVTAPAGEPCRYVLIDGYRRVAALKRLGHDTVDAVVLELSELEALCLRHRLEGVKQHAALEQGWLLSELIERHGVSQSKLAQLLGHSISWISRRLALVRELPEQAQDLVRTGRLCPHGAMRHLIPLARAKRTDCVELIAHLAQGQTELTERQLGRLVLAWRSASDTERTRIVTQPLLYLQAEAAAADPKEQPLSPERLLRNDIEALCAIARRASRRLESDPNLAAILPLTFCSVWKQTQLATSELAHCMEGRLSC